MYTVVDRGVIEHNGAGADSFIIMLPQQVSS